MNSSCCCFFLQKYNNTVIAYISSFTECKFRVGMPEVNIGLIPGAGGTVRLPRAAGFKYALDMIVSGNPVKAEQALKMGVLDKVW